MGHTLIKRVTGYKDVTWSNLLRTGHSGTENLPSEWRLGTHWLKRFSPFLASFASLASLLTSFTAYRRMVAHSMVFFSREDALMHTVTFAAISNARLLWQELLSILRHSSISPIWIAPHFFIIPTAC